MGKGGLFYIYMGYFGSSTSKDVTFSVFHGVKKYRVALKPHKMYFKA